MKFVLLGVLLSIQGISFGSSGSPATGPHDQFFALPLNGSDGSSSRILDRYGIPFIESSLHPTPGGSSSLSVGIKANRIFLLGMTESLNVHAWADAADYSQRYFIGDELGQFRLEYTDNSTQVFPLIFGENVWLGPRLYQCPNPLLTDRNLQNALAASLHLYPYLPVEDGNYVAVITPKSTPIRNIVIENNPEKKGSVAISGITVETADENKIAGATVLPAGSRPPEFDKFLQEKPLRLSGVDETGAEQRTRDLRRAFYMSDELIPSHVPEYVPNGYHGPEVSFKGNVYVEILENAFYANIQDMLAKIDEDGTYHTSTKSAISWSGGEFGTYCTNVGKYYPQSWSRDLGRSLQELSELDYLEPAKHVADYSFKMAHLWEQDPALKVHDQLLPPHWGRMINMPEPRIPFENDGQGLISLFLYKLWQRLPDRDEWLRSDWADVKASGDWILWQFDHPEISGAANGVLSTTGESANGKGYSVYPDYLCMNALRGLAQMADSIGETQTGKQWRDRAEKMQKAIATQYIVSDPKYDRVWSIESAGWPNKSTVLGPLILRADYEGFAPENTNSALHSVNEATYRRLIDAYRPFGFYGPAVGYGQGFVSQAALLLDRMHDATTMLNWTAKETFDPRLGTYIVPEGVQIDPTGHFWYRAGDVGNGVQEAEIIKTLRIVIGVDDTQPDRLQLYPRMPYGWSEIAIQKYPVLFSRSAKPEMALLQYKLQRSGDRMTLEVSSDKNLGPVAIRLGAFEKKPDASLIRVNGRKPAHTSIEQSGDSWWIRFTTSVGPVASAAK